jgi:hypothetical protein
MHHLSDRVIARLRDLWTVPKLISHLNKRFGLVLDESAELSFDKLFLAIADNKDIRSGANLADCELRNLLAQTVQSFNHDDSAENLSARPTLRCEPALQEAIVDWLIAEVSGMDRCRTIG